MTTDLYTQLAGHLHALGMGYPLKDDLLGILRANFSPAEAEVALAVPNTRIPLELATAEEVAAAVGRPVAEVADVLEGLATRGLLFAGTTDGGQPGYALQQVGYGFPQAFFWKGERTPHAEDMAGRIVRYFRSPEIKETYGGTPTKAYRYIPVKQAIEGPFQAVYPYEMREAVIRRARTIAVAYCPCRMTAQLVGKATCDHPLEVCMKSDELAAHVIERGRARQVAGADVAQRQRLESPLREASSEPGSTATVAVEALPAPAADAAYLLEIGVEELPAADLATLMEQIREKTPALLAAHRLPHGDIRVYGTPRRLAVLVDAIPPQQPDSEELVRGPAVKVAFDSDGEPTKAALGFARGKGVPVQDLERREMDGGEYVVAVVRAAGRPAAAVLAELAPALIAELKVARSMRWRPGDGVSFSRPIRWLVSLLADAVVPFEYAGVRAGRDTRTIRPHGGQALSVPDAAAYLSLMEENAIMVDRDRRRARVVAAAERLAAEVGGEIPADPALADEVANLIESPTAFRGQFAAEFLQLPKEVLISVMRKHQRYFPVVKDGKLLPYFVGVRNGDREHLDVVTAGNETVIRARFADARFFVRADMQKPLAEFRPLLARLTFHEQLGTMLDKADRIEQLAVKLGADLGLSDAASATARRAAQLAKADLATSMVVEMTSLQGVMGREYALYSGESADVAAAIEQHYWPVGAGGVLPESPAATAVALADRFDSLAGLFGAGLAPTGSADPFGLRRAAFGIVQILIGNEIDFDVRAALQAAATLQPIDVPPAIVAGAGEFVTRRLRSVLQEAGFRHDVVEAVARAQGHNPHRAGQAAAQLAEWVVRPDWDTTLDNYARCVRITRGLETRLPVTSDLFVEDAERSLRAALESAAEQISPASSVDEFLTAFGALVPSIMRFFDEVLVMADDEAVRNNRLGLLQSVAALADGIVDLSALEGF